MAAATERERLTKHLEAIRAEIGANAVADPATLVADFVAAVAEVRSQVESWLSEESERGLVALQPAQFQVVEEDLGNYAYSIPGLRIMLPNGAVVWLEPMGREMFGAIGRIDLWSAKGRFVLLRKTDRTWVLTTVPFDQTTAPWTEEEFLKAFNTLVQ